MPAPVLQFAETNEPTGAGSQATTNGITSLQWASVDQPSSVANLALQSPIPIGSNSFEKYINIYVAGAAPTALQTFGIWFNPTPMTDSQGVAANLTVKFATTTLDGVAFAQPRSSRSAVAVRDYTTVTTPPGSPNLGDPANTVGQYSGFVLMQLQTATTCASGPFTIPSPFLFVQYAWS